MFFLGISLHFAILYFPLDERYCVVNHVFYLNCLKNIWKHAAEEWAQQVHLYKHLIIIFGEFIYVLYGYTYNMVILSSGYAFMAFSSALLMHLKNHDIIYLGFNFCVRYWPKPCTDRYVSIIIISLRHCLNNQIINTSRGFPANTVIEYNRDKMKFVNVLKVPLTVESISRLPRR